jgi:phenylalanine-4-hydroxylase
MTPSIPEVARAFVLEQPTERYTDDDHRTWARLYDRQRTLLQGRVCQPFIDGLNEAAIGAERVPDFAAMSEALAERTGWRVVAVPGLVPDEAFFALLAERLFPAGWWIRQPEQFDYIEEPDVFHDVFGHVPLLTNPAYADFIQAYGEAGLKARDADELKQLARLYWYTVEFGLIATQQGLRIFGAGIASSPGETIFALESASPHRIALDQGRVMRTQYRIDDYQESYFVIEAFDRMPALDQASLDRVRRGLAGERLLSPAEMVPGDRVIATGDGAYHRARRAA